ncbi:MAG: hypothetical protein M1833_004272 [Piccolia ochrophora]|nr:MAG: hypothetical protein M1833_004272 [Piccolia ochrophora]
MQPIPGWDDESYQSLLDAWEHIPSPSSTTHFVDLFDTPELAAPLEDTSRLDAEELLPLVGETGDSGRLEDGTISADQFYAMQRKLDELTALNEDLRMREVEKFKTIEELQNKVQRLSEKVAQCIGYAEQLLPWTFDISNSFRGLIENLNGRGGQVDLEQGFSGSHGGSREDR